MALAIFGRITFSQHTLYTASRARIVSRGVVKIVQRCIVLLLKRSFIATQSV